MGVPAAAHSSVVCVCVCVCVCVYIGGKENELTTCLLV